MRGSALSTASGPSEKRLQVWVYSQNLRAGWREKRSHHLLPPLSQNSWVGTGAEPAGAVLRWRGWGSVA